MRQRTARREFLRFLACSPVLAYAGSAAGLAEDKAIGSSSDATNVFQFEPVARRKLDRTIYDFIRDGADDGKTLRANRTAFDELQLRVRRLIDVSKIDTRLSLFDRALDNPILLAPIGLQGQMHADGELAVARAAAGAGHVLIASSVSTHSIGAITRAAGVPPWFQLYPTEDRGVTRELLRRAEGAGASVVALTVDSPVFGNRESQRVFFDEYIQKGRVRTANYDGLTLPPMGFQAPSLTWDFVGWLKANTSMKVVLKGIVTREDARLSIEHGADGLIVSNHGGRQEESNRSTIECLPEVVEAVQKRVPVLIDGGFRRGTDVFKALALGADAIGIGRPYVWGLAAFGQAGVEQVLDLLRAELIRIMQLAGTRSLPEITRAFVTTRGR